MRIADSVRPGCRLRPRHFARNNSAQRFLRRRRSRPEKKKNDPRLSSYGEPLSGIYVELAIVFRQRVVGRTHKLDKDSESPMPVA